MDPTNTTDPPRHRAWWHKPLVVAAAVVVLGLVSVMAVVIVATQVGFYRQHMDIQQVDLFGLATVDLAMFTPIATEGAVWAFTLMAVTLVLFNRTARFWTICMWVGAGLQAWVNAIHATSQNDLWAALVIGGLSLAAPLIVHGFIWWARQLAYGRTYSEVQAGTAQFWRCLGRIALRTFGLVADYLLHPKIAFSALRIWRGHPTMSYQDGWIVAASSYRRRVAAKYTRKATHTTWWERLANSARNREKTNTDPTPKDDSRTSSHSNHTPVNQGVTGVSHGPELPPAEPVAHTPDRDDSRTGVSTAVSDRDEETQLRDLLADDTHTATVLNRWEAELGTGPHPTHTPDSQQGVNDVTSDSHPEPGQGRHQLTPGSHPAHARDRDDSHPGSHIDAHPTETTGQITHVELAKQHWLTLRSQGCDMDAVSPSQVARELGIDRSTVSKAFKECREEEHPGSHPTHTPDQ